MRMHCVYCGETIEVTRILFAGEPPEIKERRIEFEHKHEKCGPKAVGIIADLEVEK